MKRSFTRPDDEKPQRVDVLRFTSRQLTDRVRVFVYLFETRGPDVSRGHRDFVSYDEARSWVDEMHDELEALGWSERLPQRFRK